MSRERNRGHKNVRDYRRSKPTRPNGKSILIVTEGNVTEKNYFEAVKNKLRLSNTEVRVEHPEGTDPVTLTKAVIKLRKEREREAKTSNFVVPYTEVWVVFDLEKQHDIRRTQARKAREGAKGIKFIESDPSFEYWRLLHEPNGYTTKFLPDGNAVLKELKQHCPAYTKSEVPDQATLNRVPLAVTNAMKCRKHHEAVGGSGNPSTNVDLLVRSMNSAAGKNLQFRLPSE